MSVHPRHRVAHGLPRCSPWHFYTELLTSFAAPPPEDVLVLETVVTCSTPPNLRAWCCQACQTREGKRNARKPKPLSHSDHSPRAESLVSPVDFTCYEHLDFSTGRTPLSFRVVCYCRHHREKVGFL